MYALNLGEDFRILSVTYAEHGAPGQPVVDMLPAGNVTDYLYKNGVYIYLPVPVPPVPKPEPSVDDVVDVLLGVTK